MKKNLVIVISALTISALLSACNAKVTNTNLNVSAQTNPIVETTIQEETTTTVEETITTVEETSTVEETTTTVEEQTNVEETNSIPAEITYTVSELELTMYTTKSCNVRQGASTEYDVIGTLDKGQSVAVTGKVKEVDWYEISLPEDKKGYVSGSLLSSEKPEEVVAQQPQTPAQQQTQTPPPGMAYTPEGDLVDIQVNPNTGQPLKPGESFINEEGVSVGYGGDSRLLDW